LYQPLQKQKLLLWFHAKRRLLEKVFGTHWVTDSVVDGEQQPIPVRYGTGKSFSVKPKISEKTFFYPSFLWLAPKRPLKGETPLRTRSCVGEVPRIGSQELRGR